MSADPGTPGPRAVEEAEVWALETLIDFVEDEAGVFDAQEVLECAEESEDPLVTAYTKGSVTSETLTQTLVIAMKTEQSCDRVIRFCVLCAEDSEILGPDLGFYDVFRAAMETGNDEVAFLGVQANPGRWGQLFHRDRVPSNYVSVSYIAAERGMIKLFGARNTDNDVQTVFVSLDMRLSISDADNYTELISAGIRGGNKEIIQSLLSRPDLLDLVIPQKIGRYWGVGTFWAEAIQYNESREPFLLVVQVFGTPEKPVLDHVTGLARTPEMLQWLMELGGNLRQNACHYAANARVLQAMIDLNVDPAFIDYEEDARTPLISAIKDYRLDTFTALLEMDGVEMEKFTESGYTALSFAFKSSRAEYTRALLDAGANPNIIVHLLSSDDTSLFADYARDFHVLEKLHVLSFKYLFECERTNTRTRNDVVETCRRVIRYDEYPYPLRGNGSRIGHIYLVTKVLEAVGNPYIWCIKCKKPAKKFCSQCKAVRYCGQACQLADWPAHRKICEIKP